jgi:hypothetical protein
MQGCFELTPASSRFSKVRRHWTATVRAPYIDCLRSSSTPLTGRDAGEHGTVEPPPQDETSLIPEGCKDIRIGGWRSDIDQTD